MEKSKDRQAAYHIDCEFLVQNLFIVRNLVRFSVQKNKIRLSLFYNQTTVIIIIIINVIIVII